MAMTKRFSIKAPTDPEIYINCRDNLEYSITFPEGYDETNSYGLVFCIPGYGDNADSEYQVEKLRPYIADKHKVLTVGVRYHNDKRDTPDYTINLDAVCSWYHLGRNYFQGMNGNQVIEAIFELLKSRNIFSLESRLAFKTTPFHKYSSFGFLPAIDHLNVLYDITKTINIDKRNIIAFGTSYGGYIASLMAKYAPQTFSLVIDNSGFCVSQLSEVFGGQIGGCGATIPRYIDNLRYEIPVTLETVWSLEENSPYYFSDSHKQIRSLLMADHRTYSDTMYCCYHSVSDTIAPIDLKDKMYSILEKHNPIYYKRITKEDIDGILYKNLEHGMNASLRTLFDISFNEYEKMHIKKDSQIDFDRDITYGFSCSDKLYKFSYSRLGIDVRIESLNRTLFIDKAQ